MRYWIAYIRELVNFFFLGLALFSSVRESSFHLFLSLWRLKSSMDIIEVFIFACVLRRCTEVPISTAPLCFYLFFSMGVCRMDRKTEQTKQDNQRKKLVLSMASKLLHERC